MKKVTIALLFLLTLPSVAIAHGLTVWTEVKDGKFTVEVNYSNGKPAANVQVEIFTAKDSKFISKGITSKNGIWITNLAEPEERLKIIAGKSGHHKKTTYYNLKSKESS